MKLVRLLRYISWLILGVGAAFPLCFLLRGAERSLLSSGFGIFTCCLVASPYLLAAGLVFLARDQVLAVCALAINGIMAVASTLCYYQVLFVTTGRENGLIFLFLPVCLIAGVVVSWLLLWLGWLLVRKRPSRL